MFAPHGHGLGTSAWLGCELREAAQPCPCLRRMRFVNPRILERRAILAHPMRASQPTEFGIQTRGDLAQVRHIIGGIFQLVATQGAFRPIGARLAFG
jgi:hypothetical protein